ncbi:glycoside hydrolase superfamily [Aspergillus pseudoustus]|uniref:Glycoside hydrolase superfamily n=1 Tax=Aspergillus pseudoustus TaxID=1810923 RepID=A0ABR4K1C5_9EURO
MSLLRRALSLLSAFAVLQGVYAVLDLTSNSTVAVYWGQNSFRGTGDLAQQRLGYYCDDPNIDVIILAFLITVNGPGGAPEMDFASASGGCETFPGTNLKNCPEIGTDITQCQSKNKTILLSLGGATYSEGGFTSTAAAEAGADLIWATFGPPPAAGASSQAHRPFGNATLDGYDLDFEAAVSNMGTFATKMRTLADAETAKTGGTRKFYLTAAPQCPFPDVADRDILNTDASAAIDAVWVQFYNNYCGVNAYSQGNVGNFNFETWDKWALSESKNPHVKVYLGVPANTGAAGTGYLPISSLAPVIQYSKQFVSFGGVMMWDVSQAYGNQGFLPGVKAALKGSNPLQSPKQEVSDIPVLEEEGESPAVFEGTAAATQTSAPSSVTQDASPAASTTGGLQQNQDQEGDPRADPLKLLHLLPSLLDPDADLPWIEF